MSAIIRAWNRTVQTPAIYGHCVHALIGAIWMRGAHVFTDRQFYLFLAWVPLALFALFHESRWWDHDLPDNAWNGWADVFAFLVVGTWEVSWIGGAAAVLCYLGSVYGEGRKL